MSRSPLPKSGPLTEGDLQRLIEIGHREDRWTEYKRTFTPKDDPDEFVHDVHAFANAQGGDLILGMAESKGAASAFSPLSLVSVDHAKRQIQDVLRSRSRPYLPDVLILPVELQGGGHALVVRIPRSWNAPHFHPKDRVFHVRRDGGNIQMEIEEIRNSFLHGMEATDKLRAFRRERCASIVGSDPGNPRNAEPAVHLLACSYSLAGGENHKSMRELEVAARDFPTFTGRGWIRPRIDLDGITFNGSSAESGATLWIRVSPRGAVEIYFNEFHILSEAVRRIQHKSMENALAVRASLAWEILEKIDLSPPFVFFVSHFDIKNYHLALSRNDDRLRRPNMVHLYSPEVVMPAKPESFHSALFPVFNHLWNACGLPYSPNFDETGVWLRES